MEVIGRNVVSTPWMTQLNACLTFHTQYNLRGLNGGWSKVETPQPGSVKILAEEGAG